MVAPAVGGPYDRPVGHREERGAERREGAGAPGERPQEAEAGAGAGLRLGDEVDGEGLAVGVDAVARGAVGGAVQRGPAAGDGRGDLDGRGGPAEGVRGAAVPPVDHGDQGVGEDQRQDDAPPRERRVEEDGDDHQGGEGELQPPEGHHGELACGHRSPLLVTDPRGLAVPAVPVSSARSTAPPGAARPAPAAPRDGPGRWCAASRRR